MRELIVKMHDNGQLEPVMLIVRCKDCIYQKTCIHSISDDSNGEGFCKWGKAKDGEQE